jgi:hypothetical protein
MATRWLEEMKDFNLSFKDFFFGVHLKVRDFLHATFFKWFRNNMLEGVCEKGSKAISMEINSI